jgi:nanoRNase/pAp phosphatase (c-di-AMP/oligoRNAs hydrolase)
VFGIVDETIHLAARSKDIRLDIRNVLDDAFGEPGETGGHSTQASAAVPLGIFTGLGSEDDNRDALLALVEEAVTRNLFAALGVEGTNGDENGS